MIVKYFAFIREYAGVKETGIEGCQNLRELLKRICTRHGKKFADKIFSGDRLSEDIIILINGRHIEHLEGLDTTLEESDEISIFPKVAGG